MSGLPEWVKRPLRPVWNGGCRFGWRVGEHAGAIRRRRFARCAVCGRFGPMLYRRWVIPPELERRWGLSPALAEALARKESSDCFACGAKLRARRLARALLDLYPVGSPAAPARSVRAWARTEEARRLRIAELNTIDGLHAALSGLPGLSFSEHREGAAPGEAIDGIRCENLMNLSYEDKSFDLVLTSETLEHVPDLDAALGEVWRVLRPGGRHLFTIPLLPRVATTYARARMGADGSVEALVEPLVHHPGGDRGYLVFTEFGADVIERLDRAGFDAAMWYGPPSEDDLGQVFVAQKR